MRKFLPIFLTALMVVASVATLKAESSQEAAYAATAKTATIRGRVLDTEANTLPGAVVYIADQQIGTVSDVNGYYTIQGVTPGEHTVEVTYVGYTSSTAQINTTAGETLMHEVTLSEGTEIDAIVVQSVMQGQHRAINSQKNALNLVDVVSSEQTGKYPDSNIGDALKRISGINVQYDQGEARFGQVRGTPADLSSVTINGNRVPSAEGETRAVQLDLIPSDMIQTIEVNKVVTPDMDADAIGGSINLVTKNSPSRESLTATAGLGYNVISKKTPYNFAATYGNNFAKGKLGLVLSASYQNNFMGSDNVEYVWSEDGYVEEAQIRQYYVQRQRQSYSASLNYNINENHKLDFKGIFNRRHDWENRYRFVLEDIDSEGNAGYVEVQTKGGSEDNKYTRLELQQTMDYTLGGEHLFGALKMDWSASYAKASELRPDERYITYVYEDGVSFDADYTTNEGYPFFTVKDADADKITIAGGQMELDELSESQQTIYEEDFKFKVDFQLPLSQGEYGSRLKFGAKYVSKNKQKEVYAYELDESYATTAASNLVNQNRSGFMVGDNYKVGDFVSREWLGSVDFNNDDIEYVAKESAENFEAKENVTSAYIRYDQKLGSKLDLMAGVRMENTALTYSGYEVTKKQDMESLGDLERIEGEQQSYTNFLPAVMMKWDVSDNFKLRAAFSNTIARPDYSDLAPNVYIDGSKISVGNSDLEATISYNGDLFIDYYMSNLGLIRGGVFFKKINGFIVDAKTTYTEGTYNELADKDEVTVTQAINAGNAVMAGVELSMSRDFSFISPSLRCLGFAATYTYTYSKVTDFNIEGREDEDLSMPGSPEHTANISLYFEKKGFSARLSYNFASDFLDEYDEDAYLDVYYDKVSYLDVNVSYTFGKSTKYTVFADVTNILNQPLRYYQGGNSKQTYQCEYYGVRSNIGFKINF